ncbi:MULTISPECIES: NAD-dependent epimerase/dehydratase family protein [Streptomyces]|uniref:NAD-dependent epimerase/dehydratase n=1 Tax=Streptomyces dengpaensis TaxID=2049881 RepID=A0ABM6SMX3_9ACTN|nr:MULTISPECIES: NAD-dependent epimerase/dehydratase family protein [Streptomyces]AVH55997.1 NAD-dependent epimerase/dehydratase [Streptomyces dengpaensis]PIB12247.1 NAD-dependent epimerase/dehydratase [Streptomyces sp. HG99]
MDIVGTGFLARNLRPLAGRHPDTVALAAGVSWASGTSDADFAREAALLRDVAKHCVATGRRLLFFSTASTGMYGLAEGPGREDTPVVPCTPYGAHKVALEGLVRETGADHLILRLGHLVGPNQPEHQLLPTLVRQLREGVVRVHRGAARDLIAVRDVITVIDRLLATGLRSETVNVASGHAVPVDEIVDHLAAGLGLVARREYLDIGGQHVISIEKLRSLVPQVAAMGFGPDYYRRVLTEFTAAAHV